MVKSKRKDRNHNNRRKRPIAVIIILLLVIGEILLRLFWVGQYALQSRIWINGLPSPWWGEVWLTDPAVAFALAAFRLLWSLVAIAVLVDLLRMRRWSWVVLVIWAGTSLAVGILHYFYRAISAFHPADYAVLAADMILVFALNQSEVQSIYGIRSDDVEPAV